MKQRKTSCVDLFFNFNSFNDAKKILEPYAFLDRYKFIQYPLWLPTRTNLKIRALIKQNHRTINKLINLRLEDPVQRMDILNLLLHTKNTETDLYLTRHEVINEMSLLILGGADTVGKTLSWLLHFLVLHPHILEKVRQEIKCNINLDRITMLDLNKTHLY